MRCDGAIRGLSLPNFTENFDGNAPTEALIPVQPHEMGVCLGICSQVAVAKMANGPSTAASRKILMVPRLYAITC